VDGDERKIHSVITNVLANAEKFSPTTPGSRSASSSPRTAG